MARQTFQLHCQVEQPTHVGFGFIRLRQFGNAVERTLQIPLVGWMVGYQLRQPVDLPITHLEHAPGILQHRTRFQAPESNNLRHMIATIFTLDITDDFLAPGFAEIDVEIGHRHARRIEKPLEQQPQLKRVQISNRQRPSHH